jgi:uncharacterized membrane protein
VSKLSTLWRQVVDSLWFLPALLTLAGAVLAMLAVNLGDGLLGDLDATELWWLFGGGAEGARGVLGAIAGSIITVTGVVFSVTIVALQLASTQFTPRVLRQFMSDRANQLVLGVFIGTFTYTLLVQRTVRSGSDDGGAFVPALAVTGAVVLALTSIAFLIFFIDHLARSIQAESVIDRVARETLRVIDELHLVGEAGRDPDAATPAQAPARVQATGSGYVRHVEEQRLLEIAAERTLVVRVDKQVGEFVYPGESLFSVWPAVALDRGLSGTLETAVLLGPARTPYRDIELGLVELVDIAVKALSPGINDPTTAMTAIDRLGEVVLALSREPPHGVVREDGRGIVITARLTFGRAVGVAFDQVRHFGAAIPAVAEKLVNTLGDIAALAPAGPRASLLEAIEHVRRHSVQAIADPGDRDRVVRAADDALARGRALALRNDREES